MDDGVADILHLCPSERIMYERIINGQADWRLPTLQELHALYTSGTMNSQGWTLNFTWSSTPNGVGNHYAIALNDGTAFPFIDTTYSYMTCVR